MILLRCPKFLRCLTADAGNFDRGHSLTSLPLPPAALSSLPTSARLHRIRNNASVGGGVPDAPFTIPLAKPVIARPVRKLVVAIRFPVLKSTFRYTQTFCRKNPEGFPTVEELPLSAAVPVFCIFLRPLMPPAGVPPSPRKSPTRRCWWRDRRCARNTWRSSAGPAPTPRSPDPGRCTR